MVDSRLCRRGRSERAMARPPALSWRLGTVAYMELHGDAAAPALAPHTAAQPSARVRIIDSAPELGGLSQRWSQLEGDGAPMQHFAWSQAAAEVFAEDRLRVFAVERDGRVCAFAPLVARGAMLP